MTINNKFYVHNPNKVYDDLCYKYVHPTRVPLCRLGSPSKVMWQDTIPPTSKNQIWNFCLSSEDYDNIHLLGPNLGPTRYVGNPWGIPHQSYVAGISVSNHEGSPSKVMWQGTIRPISRRVCNLCLSLQDARGPRGEIKRGVSSGGKGTFCSALKDAPQTSTDILLRPWNEGREMTSRWCLLFSFWSWSPLKRIWSWSSSALKPIISWIMNSVCSPLKDFSKS